MPNKAIKFAPYGRRTLVPRAVYGERYVIRQIWDTHLFEHGVA